MLTRGYAVTASRMVSSRAQVATSLPELGSSIWCLPEVSGFELLVRRASPRTADLPDSS